MHKDDPEISKAILEYHDNSDAEQQSAKRLAQSLKPWRYLIPPGPILEAGAGTGLFTDYMITLFPNRKITITDRSDEMIAFHRSRFKERENLTWQTKDIEDEVPEEQSCAMICGNHVVHQFKQPASALEKLSKALSIDGIMLMGFPGEDSFKEWRSTCLDLGLPYAGKQLPETEPLVIHLSMGPFQVDFYEDQTTIHYQSFSQFLNHCENGGNSIVKESHKHNPNELALINENWQHRRVGNIGITYHNVFLAVKRLEE